MTARRPARRRSRVRGVAVIVLVAGIGLLAALCAWQLTAATASQARAAALHAREIEASAAAESGLAWMLGRLNGGAVDAACRPVADGRAAFASRWLAIEGDRPVVRPTTGTGPGPAFGCVRNTADPDGWRCDCSGAPVAMPPATTPPATEPVAAFAVSLVPTPAADGTSTVVVRSVGCVRADADCRRPPRAGELPARAMQIGLAAPPVLVAQPSAVWTATGRLDLGAGASARNPDGASAGLVLHAGGAVAATGAHLQGQAGAPEADAVAAGDTWLAGHDLDALAGRLLGTAVDAFGGLPGVRVVACDDGGCGVRVGQAAAAGATAILVRGDLALAGPVGLGTPDRPVLLVVDGDAVLRGPATVHGLVLARRLEVDGRTGPVVWTGAGVAAGDLVVQGPVDAVREAATLARLAAMPVAWLPAPGSWRDLGGVAP